MKAISAARQSPALLREMRKTLAASKEKRAVASCKAGGSAKRLFAGRTSKRKASQLGLDSSGEPATRRPAPEHASGSSSCASTSTEGQVAQSSQEPQRPAYASVAARRAALSLSVPLKPTAMEWELSDSAASLETAKRRMSQDMSGPLSGTPATTISAPAAPVPAGQRRNRTPVFTTGVTDTRGFLAWLRSRCPKGLTAQMKGENLIVVPQTADDFRAAVSALKSLDMSKGVSFHTFSFPEDRCARLLIKNLCRRMPKDVVRKELEALGICVQGVMQLRSGRRDQNPEKDRPVTPHFIVTVARGLEVSKIRSITQLCGLRVTAESYTVPKGPVQCKRYQRFGHTQRNCGYVPRCVACWEAHLSGECSTFKEQLQCCCCGGNHTANYRGYGKWKGPRWSLQGGHLRCL